MKSEKVRNQIKIWTLTSLRSSNKTDPHIIALPVHDTWHDSTLINFWGENYEYEYTFHDSKYLKMSNTGRLRELRSVLWLSTAVGNNRGAIYVKPQEVIKILSYVCAQLDHTGQLITTKALLFCTWKPFWDCFSVRNCHVIVVTSWPAQPSSAQA